MPTVNKDFKVKNGLLVSGSGSFNGPVTVGTPSSPEHATTKGYVDSLISSGISVGTTPPENPVNGTQWLDTTIERLKFYYDGIWVTVANIDDTLDVPQHIHDTSIGGSGLVVTTFVDAGIVSTPQLTLADAGTAQTYDWEETWNGGIVTNSLG